MNDAVRDLIRRALEERLLAEQYRAEYERYLNTLPLIPE